MGNSLVSCFLSQCIYSTRRRCGNASEADRLPNAKRQRCVSARIHDKKHERNLTNIVLVLIGCTLLA